MTRERADAIVKRVIYAGSIVMPKLKNSEEASCVNKMIKQMQKQLERELSLEVELQKSEEKK